MRATAVERHPLFARRRDLHRRRRQLLRDLRQLLGRDRDCSLCLDVGGNFGRHRDVEVRARQSDPPLRRLDENVREHRERSLRRSRRRYGRESFLQLLPGDCKPHRGSSKIGTELHYNLYVYINLVVLVGTVGECGKAAKPRVSLSLHIATSSWIDVDESNISHGCPAVHTKSARSELNDTPAILSTP